MSSRLSDWVTRPLKAVLPISVWRPLRALATGVVTPLRFSLQTGHWKSSLHQVAQSASGEALPWYTYPAIDFLAQRCFSSRTVLEFGGGQSTHWWAARAQKVMTIEESADWYVQLNSKIEPNVSLHHVPVDFETRSIVPVRRILENSGATSFDIIIIDGHLRRELVALAFEYLGPGGVIILDDAEGYGFYEEVKARRCCRVDFIGFAPGVSRRHCTALVYVDNSFLLQPDIPIMAMDPEGV
jgi:predicted O-methyltransferase YrrM